MLQGLIDGLEVSLHNRLTSLAIGLLNTLFNLSNRFFSWQDTADCEEAGLHDRIDTPFQAHAISNFMCVDHKHA